jgi:hypothetical protein
MTVSFKEAYNIRQVSLRIFMEEANREGETETERGRLDAFRITQRHTAEA